MSSFRLLVLFAIAFYTLPNVTLSQTSGFSNAKVSIVDGTVVLEGDYQQISAIEVTSSDQHLSLQTQELQGGAARDLTSPFDQNGLVVSHSPGKVVLGVLGAENRINFSGTTQTSVLYSESPALAQAGDFTLNIAAGSCSQPISIGMTTPVTFSCVQGSWEGGTEGGGNGGEVDSTPVFKLIDGEIYLEGHFDDLSSIEIISANGNLDLGTVTTGIPSLTPFDGQAIAIESDNSFVLGTLGSEHRIDITGETRTSIKYAETLDFATSDLTVNIGLGDNSPESIMVGSVEELTERGVTVQDGFLTMVGSFSQLAGIEAISEAGHLFIEEVLVEGTKLFPASDATIVSNDEHRIVIDATNSVDFSGLIATGISFSGGAEAFALADLQVLVSLGSAPPVSLPDTTETVPEPSSAFLTWVAALGALYLCRKSRRRS